MCSGVSKSGENKSSYVLGRFREDERSSVDAAINKAADASEAWLTRGIAAAMNTFNTRAADQPRKAQTPKPERPAESASDSAPSDRTSSDTIDPGWLAGP